MPAPAPTNVIATQRWQLWTLIAACFSQFMIQLDVTIVNVTLPSIQQSLAANPAKLVWIVNAYVLPVASLILVGGTLGDRYGRKRIFLIGFALFTAFSVGCALSTTADVLITFRALQGVGAALLAPSSLSLLAQAFGPERRPWAIGMWATISGLGFGMGPVIAGLLLRAFAWPAIFWVNVPIGIVGGIVAAAYVHESRNPDARRLDLVGALLISSALFCLTFALVETHEHAWLSAFTLVFVAAAVLLAVSFLFWESRSTEPMLPLEFFRLRAFTIANADMALAYAALAATLFFVSLFFQNVEGYSALRTGFSWLAMNIPFLSMAAFAGRLQARFGARHVVIVGLAVGGLGILDFTRLDVGSTYLMALPGYLLFGAGYGIAVPAISAVAMGAVPVENAGVASGVLNAARQVGYAIGLPALSSIGAAVAFGPWSDPPTFVLAMRVALALAGSLVIGAALLTALGAAKPPRPS